MSGCCKSFSLLLVTVLLPWEALLDGVHDKLKAEGRANATNPDLLTSKPAPLPTLTLVMPGDEQDDEEPCADDDENECEKEEAA
ncbi:MAG: hypothetical protein FJ125_15810 [Deltaproteobacteria bacterium]|nr:hypothetical protein [Deltaproteobacteria bacterium]